MKEYDTIKYYDEHAEEYVKQTRYGDMNEFCDRFLSYLPKGSYILDFGCGSGRDSKYFIEQGYKVKAIDGSKELCKLASLYIGQEVIHMTFDELTDIDIYDGIWACASLLHVERNKLPDILRKMIKSVKNDGIIYLSFKIGDFEEIIEGKYYNYITKDIIKELLKNIDCNVELIDYLESSIRSGIDRPSTLWGSYIIKKHQ